MTPRRCTARMRRIPAANGEQSASRDLTRISPESSEWPEPHPRNSNHAAGTLTNVFVLNLAVVAGADADESPKPMTLARNDDGPAIGKPLQHVFRVVGRGDGIASPLITKRGPLIQ